MKPCGVVFAEILLYNKTQVETLYCQLQNDTMQIMSMSFLIYGVIVRIALL